MKLIKFFCLTVFLFLLTAPAIVQAQGRTGMAYTTKGERKYGSTMGRIDYDTGPEDIGKQDAPKESGAGQTPSSRVWEKYKALAAGQHKKDETVEKSKEQAAQSTPQKTGSPAGIAGLIQQYQQNKDARRGMKSIKVSRPEVLEKALVESEGEKKNIQEKEPEKP